MGFGKNVQYDDDVGKLIRLIFFSKFWEGSEGEIKCAMKHVKAC